MFIKLLKKNNLESLLMFKLQLINKDIEVFQRILKQNWMF